MVAGIDRVSTRGGEYVLNRYYVEKITTTYNSNGVTTKVTLNPFASSLSSYNDIYKDAMDAWQQANCQTSTTNGSSGSTVTGTVSNGQRDMASTAEEALNRFHSRRSLKQITSRLSRNYNCYWNAFNSRKYRGRKPIHL